VSPLGRTGGTLTRTAGTLLTIGLLAAAGYFAAGECALRALTAIRKMSHYDSVQRMSVYRLTEGVFGKLDIAYYLTGNVV